MTPEPVLQVRGLKKHFPIRSGVFSRVVGQTKAVDGVDFDLHGQETLGLVGESGCGKTTTGLCVIRGIEPTAGTITAVGENGGDVDVRALAGEELRKYRRNLQMIFQDPFSSLNPRMTVLEIITEPLTAHGIHSASELEDRAVKLLLQVGLDGKYLRRYPHAFSGGQRQRIGIARALSLSPKLIVADEPVSALDVSVQAQIINLMKDLQADLGVSYVFISHDLSVVKYISDRVAVMYLGRIVEHADTAALYQEPRHPYTEALLQAVPKADPAFRDEEFLLTGEVPDPSSPPPGCHFHTRCPYAEPRCATEAPQLREVAPGRQVACHLAEQLELAGVAESATPGKGRTRS